MLSDDQKRNLSAIAKGRSRDSKGRLMPATSAHEAKIAELEAQVSELEQSLSHAAEMDRHTTGILSSLTAEVEAQGSARRLAEGRYVALLRRRSIEWGILITSIVGGIVIAGLFALVNGGR